MNVILWCQPDRGTWHGLWLSPFERLVSDLARDLPDLITACLPEPDRDQAVIASYGSLKAGDPDLKIQVRFGADEREGYRRLAEALLLALTDEIVAWLSRRAQVVTAFSVEIMIVPPDNERTGHRVLRTGQVTARWSGSGPSPLVFPLDAPPSS